ncbi:serine protein kinase RIO [Candidatus Woesearchaeota archaeon]|nr:serine protein kinase RIO [Candidatus Woesearchaeota archaeon]
MAKTTKEKFKTYKNVFDNFTIRTILKLISQNHFDGLSSPLFIGKESNVFTAEKEDEVVVVKIYRLETCDFKKMFEYIRCDERYTSLRRTRREIIFSWVQREYRNILKAREAGVLVPKPLAIVNNIIVMELIGDGVAAPKLKDHYPKNPKKFFAEVLKNMKRMHKADLVHGDLSEFNILNHNETPYFIDFSQCTLTKSPNATELLERDVRNIVKFFNKLGLELDEKEVMKKIIK